MPISGIVVTFSSAVTDHSVSIEALEAISEIEMGAASGSKLAIVVDSASRDRDREIWDAVQELPGVVDISVAMVAFDEP